ncbi:MAG: hypothetical protein KatS3mg002_0487 [Candidatus Woesearchaeota archaeon]|nr:MAG: hypothetical protein KatS3mg002_0487 [Candidatus Woesearchaeota archaeon]
MKKKGATDFIPTVLVKLVFAVGLILLLTWFLISIYTAIFGNENKTEKDNFNTLFNLIESKSKSNKEYDSAKLTIYLIRTNALLTDHTIHFFPANKDYISCNNGKPIYRPSTCDIKDKPCLCLYDSDPDRAEDEADDDVIICKQFSTNFKIENTDFQLVDYNNDCSRTDRKQYIDLIVGVENANNNKRVFVWLNNESNRLLDEKLKKKLCPEKTGLCSGKRDGDVINDFYDLQRINSECKANDYFYHEAKCVFEKDKCKVECIGTKCDTIKSCSDFNINEDFYIAYTNQEYFCNNNACNKNCVGSVVEQYTCIKGKEEDCKKLLNNQILEEFTSSCSVVIGQFSELTSQNINYQNAKIIELGDIISFDSKKQNSKKYNCKAEIEKYFKKYPVFVCKEGVDCNGFVTKSKIYELITNIERCSTINPFRAAGTIVMTRVDDCPEIKTYFTEAYTCSNKKIERFI